MNIPERLGISLSGRYTIERDLGEGGMATVYLALDLRHQRKVALKVLRPALAAVVGAERFLAEIRSGSPRCRRIARTVGGSVRKARIFISPLRVRIVEDGDPGTAP